MVAFSLQTSEVTVCLWTSGLRHLQIDLHRTREHWLLTCIGLQHGHGRKSLAQSSHFQMQQIPPLFQLAL